MHNNKKKTDITVLVITGSINITPYIIPTTSLTDLNIRLEQYLKSIEYAIENYHEITHIVFCENTDYNFDYSFLYRKANQHNKTFELLSFKGSYPIIQKQGKGYGEGEIIQYAINNSLYLKKSSFFFKLTGRLVIKNMDKIINSTKSDCAFEMIPSYIYNNSKNYVSTTFYKVNKSLYINVLSDAYKDVNDFKENYLENIFFERLKDLNLTSFNIPPHISGQSGSSGKYYDLNFKSRIKQIVLYYLGVVKLKKTKTEKIICSITVIFFKTGAILKAYLRSKIYNKAFKAKNKLNE